MAFFGLPLPRQQKGERCNRKKIFTVMGYAPLLY
jgi:hypothetical protein